MVELFANSRDPDQMPCSVASDLGLYCLPVACAPTEDLSAFALSAQSWLGTPLVNKGIRKNNSKTSFIVRYLGHDISSIFILTGNSP